MAEKNRKLQLFLIISIILSLSLNVLFLSKDINKLFSFYHSSSNEAHLLKRFPDNKPYVYFAYSTNSEAISDIPGHQDAVHLPDSLIIPPGVYNYHGYIYQLNKEGLYRFFHYAKGNQQRIVFNGNLDALLSGLSWMVSLGTIDNGKSAEELNSKASKENLFLTCGPTAKWVNSILNKLGIKSRLVSSLTLGKWNQYDNGHTLIEVFRKKYNKYVLYDIILHTYFLYKDRPLSLVELINHVSSDDYDIRSLANINASYNFSNDYDYGFIIEYIAANEKSLRRWYKRVMQVAMIHDGGQIFFFDEKNRARIEGYSSSYKYMDKREFLEKYY